MAKLKLPKIKDVAALVRSLKTDIEDDFRAYDDSEDDIPSMLLTVGCDTATGEWGWQTGDNSYTGGAYGYPHWGVAAIYRRSNSIEVARAIVDEIAECGALIGSADPYQTGLGGYPMGEAFRNALDARNIENSARLF